MHERLLHTAWADLAFDLSGLTTTGGERLEIIDTGRINHGGGPDFEHAGVRIGGLLLHGSVEIHLRSSDWYRHGHHKDPAYNRVVLHTVLEDDLGYGVERQDGTRPATFDIRPCLNPSFLRMLDLGSSLAIPCSGQVRYLNDEVIRHQLAKAGREYFDDKTRRLLQYFEPSLTLTEAWPRLLQRTFFDLLGLPANRKPMAGLLEKLLYAEPACKNLSMAEVWRMSGLYGNSPGSLRREAWDLKGCRPAASPSVRIPQAVWLFNRIAGFPVRTLPRMAPRDSWSRLTGGADVAGTEYSDGISGGSDTTRPGKDTLETLFYAGYLPALWLLGSLIHDIQLQMSVWELWERAHLPHAARASRPLLEADERFMEQTGKPGTFYQYRNYCRKRRCDECGIFRALISA
jgi:hypothetical protein